MLARMMTTALTRSIPFWLLNAIAVVAVAGGGWLVWDNTSTMQRTFLDGTATNVEVYVGQAWITAGAAVLAAGVIGILLSLGLAAAKALIPATPVEDRADAPSTGSGAEDARSTGAEDTTEEQSSIDFRDDGDARDGADANEAGVADQNGSSGSIATATKISVK